MKVVVTGASGFIGRYAVAHLRADMNVVPVLRRPDPTLPDALVVSDFLDQAQWAQVLEGVDGIAHLAGRAHVLKETEDPRAAFHRSNVEVSQTLIQAALASGVDRFVFMSSIGVVGPGQPTSYLGPGYAETELPRPISLYTHSKLAAEHQLEAAVGERLALTILRPPLVVGPGAPGNLARLRRAVARGWPMPFLGLGNRRTLVSLEGVATAIGSALRVGKRGVRRYHLAHREALSTADIIRSLARGMNRSPRLVPFPARSAQAWATLLGQASTFQKLFGSLVLDARRAEAELGWRDPKDPQTGLEEAGRA